MSFLSFSSFSLRSLTSSSYYLFCSYSNFSLSAASYLYFSFSAFSFAFEVADLAAESSSKFEFSDESINPLFFLPPAPLAPRGFVFAGFEISSFGFVGGGGGILTLGGVSCGFFLLSSSLPSLNILSALL